MGTLGRVARVSICLLFSGCPGPSELVDAGADGGTDAASAIDAGHDAGADAALDGGGDVDAGDDTGVAADAGHDAASCDASGSAELCNGRDDDCNGTIDEGCTCTPGAPVPITSGFYWAITTTSGGGFAVASQDFSTGALDVGRYAADFSAVGAPTTLVLDDTRPPGELVLFPLGAEIGAIWRQWPSSTTPVDDLWFAHVSASTGALTAPIDLTPAEGALGHSVAPNGAGFVVARRAATGPGAAVRSFDASGVLLAGPNATDTARTVAYTGVGVVGTTIGAAYQSDGGSGFDVRFARFDASAAPIGTPIDVATGAAVRPFVAAQASGWGIVWEDGTSLSFAAVDAAGALAVTPHALPGSGGGQGLSIAADGAGGWGILFRGTGGARFTYLDATGAPRGPDVELPGYSVTGTPSLVFDGTRFVAVVLGPDTSLWSPCARF